MKRRIYNISAQRKCLLDEALATVRRTRETIDPELLETVRAAIGAAMEQRESQKIRPMQLDRVPVDQKKTLSIALKFLEMQPENKALQREISSFLSPQ